MPRLAYLLLAPLLLLAPFIIKAQILNVEKARVDADSSDYFLGTVSLSLTMNNRGSTDDEPVRFIGLTTNADLAYISGLHSYKLISFLEYLSTNDQAFINTGYSHFRTNLYRQNKVSTELFAQYQFDAPRGLENRMLAGGGLRIRIHRSDNLSLHFGPGLMFEHEEWQKQDEAGIIVKDLFKSTNYISTRVAISEHAELNAIAYYQVGYDEAIDDLRRWSADVNLRLKVIDVLSFRTTFTTTYENRPIIPIQKYLYVLTNGLIFDF